MISDQLKKLLESHPEAMMQLNQIADKFSKRVTTLGHEDPIITKQTMHLMAVEMQIVLRNHGLDARVIIEKKGGGASVTLTSPEESRRLFAPKKKE